VQQANIESEAFLLLFEIGVNCTVIIWSYLNTNSPSSGENSERIGCSETFTTENDQIKDTEKRPQQNYKNMEWRKGIIHTQ
jgi:hypothetical protein